MKKQEEMTAGDFQKLLQIGLQSLSIQRTLLENQVADLNNELRTLERDDELEKLDRQILLIQQDYDHYREFVDSSVMTEWTGYYD